MQKVSDEFNIMPKSDGNMSTMTIRSLKIKNFRCFRDYHIDFPSRFTLLIGNNGSGKTAILDSLALALKGELQNIGEKFHPPYNFSKDLRLVEHKLGQALTKEVAGTLVLELTGNLFGDNSFVKFIGEAHGSIGSTSGFDRSDLWEQVRNGKPELLPVIAYYGSGRLWTEVKTSSQSVSSRLEGYKECLSPASNQKGLFEWFQKEEFVSSQKSETRYALEAVRQAIRDMIPDADKVQWDAEYGDLYIESKDKKIGYIPFNYLSDGYRNMVGLAGDIAWRMAQLNPQLEGNVINQTPGVVLIDELDLHLHPKWQRYVVDRLLKTFPNVQFIASSHSPFIIQSLYQNAEAMLWSLDDNKYLDVDSASVEDIAEDKQDVGMPQQSQRFKDMMDKATEYYNLLELLKNADDEKCVNIRKELDLLEIPYSEDPAYSAFIKMQRIVAESAREAQS